MKQFFRRSLIAASVALTLASPSLLFQNVRQAVAQGFIGVFQNGTPTVPSVYGIGDPTSGFFFGTGIVSPSKHFGAGSIATANLPVVSACGTSAALATGSTDFAGKITVGTSASNGCTLTFGTTYTTGPFCTYQNLTTGAAANVLTISATALAWSSALADSTVLIYHCIAVGS